MGPVVIILVFSNVKSPFYLPLSPWSRGSLVSLLFLPLECYHLHIWDCWYVSQCLDSRLWFIQLAFPMIHSACKLNKQGDNIQPCCTPFPIWISQLFLVWLHNASWPTYKFLCNYMKCSTPGSPVLRYLSELAQIHSHLFRWLLSNHLILWYPLLLFPSFSLSIRAFSN